SGNILRSLASGLLLGWTRTTTTLILFALLGRVSMPPIRVHLPTPRQVCPAGYSICWPEGKVLQNERYAECGKDVLLVAKARYAQAAKNVKYSTVWEQKS